MTRYFDDYEDFEEFMEEENIEDYEPVVGVTFESSNKIYHYYTDEELEKGDRLLVRQYQGKEVVVTVIGYCDDNGEANKSLNIIRRREQKTRRTNKYKREEKTTMKKTSKAMENTKEALTEAKDVALKLQEGNSVIIAIKTALYASDIIPEKVKLLINSGQGISDLVIGLALQIVAETFTESEVIQRASKAANFSGAISASSEFTLIQETIERVVASGINKVNVKTDKEGTDKKEAKK